jgi:FkbM family methyltransferase
VSPARDPSSRLSLNERVRRFWKSPFYKKSTSFAYRLRQWFPRMPVPLQLSSGAWWIVGHSVLDLSLLGGGFETGESLFAAKYLKAGMTVIDIGAHHGLYTLLASKNVGKKGRVIAFEPSARERRRLERHVRLNLCRNVTIEPLALGERESRARFFLAGGGEDWCNSLRQLKLDAGGQEVEVQVMALDEYVASHNIERVDFLKIDVEGGELEALRGAIRLLSGANRPVVLAEVSDVHTAAWGYRAEEILQLLAGLGYQWYSVDGQGELRARVSEWGAETYDENFVAMPSGKRHEGRPGGK